MCGRPEFDTCLLCGALSKSSHNSDFKICTPVVTLSGVLHGRDSIETGRSGVSLP